jgi:methylenetetrahydrofolate dehydrogenase (NAD+)
LETALQQSDVVITGVPSDTFKLDVDLLKEGVVAVNFSSFKNIPPEIKSKASIFVPSVGKVTIAMLERNLLRLHEYQSRQ